MFVVPIMRRLRIRSIPEFLELRYSRGLRTLIGAFWGVRLCVYLGILIYIASTAAIIITGAEDTAANYVKGLVLRAAGLEPPADLAALGLRRKRALRTERVELRTLYLFPNG